MIQIVYFLRRHNGFLLLKIVYFIVAYFIEFSNLYLIGNDGAYFHVKNMEIIKNLEIVICFRSLKVANSMKRFDVI